MEWLNYHHLLYFHTVVRAGTMVEAARMLGLAQPTLSAQIRQLEHVLGERLFERTGRRLKLTDVGRVAARYAEEIFALGRELQDAIKGRPTTRPARLVVGVADGLPKLVAHRVLAPALALGSAVCLTVHEDRTERLMAALAVHDLDVVLSDSPLPPSVRLRAFSHVLGECEVALYGVPRLATRLRRRFPQSLEGAPLLFPAAGTSLRHSVDHWIDRLGVRPRMVGEFDDSALMKAFAQAGAGVFAAPTVIEREIRRQYGVRRIGLVAGACERFYAVSVERRITHPGVAAITRAARHDLFA